MIEKEQKLFWSDQKDLRSINKLTIRVQILLKKLIYSTRKYRFLNTGKIKNVQNLASEKQTVFTIKHTINTISHYSNLPNLLAKNTVFEIYFLLYYNACKMQNPV